MADFAQIQQKLNSDEGFRQRFLQDPVQTVKSEGVALSPQYEEALIKFVDQIKSQPAQPSGSTTTANINGGIAIGIRF